MPFPSISAPALIHNRKSQVLICINNLSSCLLSKKKSKHVTNRKTCCSRFVCLLEQFAGSKKSSRSIKDHFQSRKSLETELVATPSRCSSSETTSRQRLKLFAFFGKKIIIADMVIFMKN